MGILMWTNVALAAVNAVLALVLGWVYAQNHRQVRSPMTLGLLLFAAFFVVHNVLVAYHYLTMMPQFLLVDETWLFLESLLQLGGLAALVYATLR